jgi:hypothetical protein
VHTSHYACPREMPIVHLTVKCYATHAQVLSSKELAMSSSHSMLYRPPRSQTALQVALGKTAIPKNPPSENPVRSQLAPTLRTAEAVEQSAS